MASTKSRTVKTRSTVASQWKHHLWSKAVCSKLFTCIFKANSLLVNGIQGAAEGEDDDDSSKRLLAAAKVLADATAQLVDAAKVGFYPNIFLRKGGLRVIRICPFSYRFKHSVVYLSRLSQVSCNFIGLETSRGDRIYLVSPSCYFIGLKLHF